MPETDLMREECRARPHQKISIAFFYVNRLLTLSSGGVAPVSSKAYKMARSVSSMATIAWSIAACFVSTTYFAYIYDI